MAEFQKVMKDYYRMHNTYYNGHCDDCPLNKKNNEKQIGCDDFLRLYPAESDQIIEDWAEKNPVMTNGMMFEKTFGYAPGFCCVKSKNIECPDDISCSDCPYSLDAEYHAPEGSEK